MIDQTPGAADVAARLARRAQDDAAFRRQLLADPKAIVGMELGKAGAEHGSTMREQGAQDHYLVLPLTPTVPVDGASARGKISDADLETCVVGYPPPCFDCIGQGCLD